MLCRLWRIKDIILGSKKEEDWEDLPQTKETELEEENDFDDGRSDKIIDIVW